MSAPHPLNQAVIAQALYDLRNGQLRRCKLMGFGEEELDALKHPALISVLANANVSWCSVTVNREVLRRLLKQAQDVEKEITTVDRMLRLGASTEMVSRFYGLTHQEVALRREILGLPKRKGRHPVLDETQDTELWRQWKAVTSSRNVDLEDETSILDAAMDLAEGMAETVAKQMPTAEEIAAARWLTDDELAVYAGEYERTGFQGGLNWYRARTSGRVTPELEIFTGRTIDQPSTFISGKSDWGNYQSPGALEKMQKTACTNMKAIHMVEGAGHWVQQEQAAEVSRLLIKFLKETTA